MLESALVPDDARRAEAARRRRARHPSRPAAQAARRRTARAPAGLRGRTSRIAALAGRGADAGRARRARRGRSRPAARSMATTASSSRSARSPATATTTDARHLTANVNLWPRPLVIFVNKEAFAGLATPAGRARRGAARARSGRRSPRSRRDEKEAAATLCRRGVTFVTAANADVAALRRAVQPVYDRLEARRADQGGDRADPRDAGRRGSDPGRACVRRTAAGDGPPASPRRSTACTASSRPPKDVRQPAARGPGRDLVSENYGHWRFVLDRGRLTTRRPARAQAAGRAPTTPSGATRLTSRSPPTAARPPRRGREDRRGVHLPLEPLPRPAHADPVTGEISPENFRAKPWRRIGDAD